MAISSSDLRHRLDLTEKTDSSERRLDSLARLLAVGSGSVCVAIAVFNKQLIIASNSFFAGANPPRTGTRDNNEELRAIREILDYFRKVANGEDPSTDTRKAMFIKICKMAKSKPRDEPYATLLGDKRFEKLINALLSGQNPKISVFKKEYDEAYADATAAYAVFHKLLQAFTKSERSLIEKRNLPDNEQLSDEYFQAFIAKPLILRIEQKQNVHAEVQILGEIVRAVEESRISSPQEIYVGISKLCCLDCRVMMEECVEVLQERGITLEVRGHHDLSFKKGESGWISPKQFSEGYDAGNIAGNVSLSFRIGYNSRIAADDLRQFELQEHVYQSPGHSGSEQSPLSMGIPRTGESVIDILRESRLHVYDKLTKHGWTAITIDHVLPIMLHLLQIQSFSDLLTMGFSSDCNRSFQAVLKELQEIIPNFSSQELQKILQDPVLVGGELARYFTNISEVSIQPHVDPTHSTSPDTVGLIASLHAAQTSLMEQYQDGANIGESEYHVPIEASSSDRHITPQADMDESRVQEPLRKKPKIEPPKPSSPTKKYKS